MQSEEDTPREEDLDEAVQEEAESQGPATQEGEGRASGGEQKEAEARRQQEAGEEVPAPPTDTPPEHATPLPPPPSEPPPETQQGASEPPDSQEADRPAWLRRMYIPRTPHKLADANRELRRAGVVWTKEDNAQEAHQC